VSSASRIPIEWAIDPGEPLSPAEVEAVLEVAYLVMRADGRIAGEEVDAFGRIAAALRSRGMPGYRTSAGRQKVAAPLEGRPLEELLERFASRVVQDGTDARLEAIAGVLVRPGVPEVAYKVACGMAMVDLNDDDREFELDLALIAALGLTQDDADGLAAEVHQAMSQAPPSTR